MTAARAAHLAASLTALLLAALAGCGPPTDRALRVAARETPLLASATADSPTLAALHPGDLVSAAEAASVPPALSWKGRLEGREAEATGELVAVRRAAGEPVGFAFRAALGGEARAVSAAYLCHRMSAGPSCPALLRRIDTGDGGTLAYLPCPAGPCPVGLLRGRKLGLLTIEGLLDVRLATLAGERVALVRALVEHGPQWTRGTLHVLRVGPPLERALLIDTSELDVRGVRHHLKEGRVDVVGDELRLVGVERWIDSMHGNRELGSRPVAGTYRLTPRPGPR